MNPRQRRGVLLLLLAAIAAVGVFVAVGSYVSNVRSEVSPKVPVLKLTERTTAQEPIDASAVRTVQMPKRYAPRNALRDPISLVGRVASSSLPSGSLLQQGMLEPAPTVSAGERELSILVGADTGVAGRVRPGDYVDIEATFAGDDKHLPQSQIVVPHARVVAIGLPKRVSTKAANGAVALQQDEVPVTFALTPQETLVVTYAESFADEVRLALARKNDETVVPRSQRRYLLGPPGATTTPPKPPKKKSGGSGK